MKGSREMKKLYGSAGREYGSGGRICLQKDTYTAQRGLWFLTNQFKLLMLIYTRRVDYNQ